MLENMHIILVPTLPTKKHRVQKGIQIMKSSLYREKNVQRASSPEQLNQYIRVSSPGVWAVLLGIIILLAGVCVWGIFGRLETTVKAVAISDGAKVVCYIRESEAASISEGNTVRINGGEYTVSAVSSQAVQADGGDFTDYALHIADFQRGEWVCGVETDGTIAAGAYYAEIVTETISPLSFVFN